MNAAAKIDAVRTIIDLDQYRECVACAGPVSWRMACAICSAVARLNSPDISPPSRALGYRDRLD
jgi:hypothetical protein